MEKEYDFSEGEIGKFYRPNKIQKTIRFDQDVIEYFQAEANKLSLGYQTLINQTLREAMGHKQELVSIGDLRKELRAILRQELKSKV